MPFKLCSFKLLFKQYFCVKNTLQKSDNVGYFLEQIVVLFSMQKRLSVFIVLKVCFSVGLRSHDYFPIHINPFTEQSRPVDGVGVIMEKTTPLSIMFHCGRRISSQKMFDLQCCFCKTGVSKSNRVTLAFCKLLMRQNATLVIFNISLNYVSLMFFSTYICMNYIFY